MQALGNFCEARPQSSDAILSGPANHNYVWTPVDVSHQFGGFVCVCVSRRIWPDQRNRRCRLADHRSNAITELLGSLAAQADCRKRRTAPRVLHRPQSLVDAYSWHQGDLPNEHADWQASDCITEPSRDSIQLKPTACDESLE